MLDWLVHSKHISKILLGLRHCVKGHLHTGKQNGCGASLHKAYRLAENVNKQIITKCFVC